MTTHLITLASGTLACCGKTPFEVPRGDRCTTDPGLATCVGGDVLAGQVETIREARADRREQLRALIAEASRRAEQIEATPAIEARKVIEHVLEDRYFPADVLSAQVLLALDEAGFAVTRRVDS